MKFSFSHGLRLSMLCVMLVLAGCAGKKQRVSYDRHAFDSAIKDAASEYGVDAKLITAMIGGVRLQPCGGEQVQRYRPDAAESRYRRLRCLPLQRQTRLPGR